MASLDSKDAQTDDLASKLRTAVEDGERAAVVVLLEKAAARGDVSHLIVKRIPAAAREDEPSGVDDASAGPTLVQMACMKNNAGIVNVLLNFLEANKRPNYLLQTCFYNTAQQTALHISAGQRSQECVEALLKNLDPAGTQELLKATNKEGRTALHEAVLQDDGSVVGLLLKRAAPAHHPEGAESFFQAQAVQKKDLGRAPTALELQTEGMRQRRPAGAGASGSGAEGQGGGRARWLAAGHLVKAAQAMRKDHSVTERAQAATAAGTALELAVKRQKTQALLPLTDYLVQVLRSHDQGEKAAAWAKPAAEKILRLAARQTTTSAMEILVGRLPLTETTTEGWRTAVKEALRTESSEMINAMKEVVLAPDVVTVGLLKFASQGKCFCAFAKALSQLVHLLIVKGNALCSWDPAAKPARIPDVLRVFWNRGETGDMELHLMEEQWKALERSPLYPPWGRAESCEAHLLPKHLLAEGVLCQALEVLALHAPVEAYSTPFVKGTVVEGWKAVWKFYYLDLGLNAVHIALALLLTREEEEEDWFARTSYLYTLLVTVSVLVLKDVCDEISQLCHLRRDFVREPENWFDAGRVLTECGAVIVLWQQTKSTASQVIVSVWVAWMWIHTLVDMRGLYGFGHHTIPVIQAIFNINVAALGCVLVFSIMGATHAYYVFGEKSELFDALKPVFGLSVLGALEPWELPKEDPRYEVVQIHIFALSFIFVVPVPLFISVLGNNYSTCVQRAAESFCHQRAMLAVEYNMAVLPKLLRYLLPKLLRCLWWCVGRPQEEPGDDGSLQVLISPSGVAATRQAEQ